MQTEALLVMNPGLSARVLLRHFTAWLLLLASWHFLSNWILYQNYLDYLTFSGLSVAGFGLAAGRFLISRIKSIPHWRVPLVCFLVLVALPWGDWLQLSTSMSREDWSRQLFWQALFLYGAVSLLELYPHLTKVIRDKTLSVLSIASSRDYVFWLPPAVFFLLSAWVSLFVLNSTPVVQDSAAHLFQAKIFNSGRLYAPAPPLTDFFSLTWDMLVIKDGRWFSMYQPGFALLLAAAMSFKAEWLLSPFLGALTVAIWVQYAKRWHGRSVALIFGILGLFSPFLLLMSSSVMVFTPELFLASGVIYLCRRQTEGATLSQSLLLFLLMVWVLLVRAFSTLPFLAPVLAYVCWDRLRVRSYAAPIALISGVAVGAGMLMYFQWKTTGNPFLPGYLLEYPDIGFGFGQHWIGKHTPLKSLENLSNNYLGLNQWLSGWYFGSVAFVIAFLARREKLEKWDRLLLLSCCGLILFYSFFIFQDLFFGPRYYYLLAPVLLLMVARSSGIDVHQHPERVSSLVTALLVLALITFLPVRLNAFLHTYNVGQMNGGYLKEEIRKVGSQKTLVFIDKNMQNYFVNWNDPFLKGPVILSRDLGERNQEVMAAFPDYHPVYFRPDSSLGKQGLQTGFHFYNEPDQKAPGYISLFQLALALQSGSRYPDKDCFDICYVDFFNSQESASQLDYLQKESENVSEVSTYRRNLHLGLIHTAEMLLLPKVAFDTNGLNWSTGFRTQSFRHELKSAVDFLQGSGEVGKTILVELEKVERRIDQNRDGLDSDQEILRFLKGKVNILTLGG